MFRWLRSTLREDALFVESAAITYSKQLRHVRENISIQLNSTCFSQVLRRHFREHMYIIFYVQLYLCTAHTATKFLFVEMFWYYSYFSKYFLLCITFAFRRMWFLLKLCKNKDSRLPHEYGSEKFGILFNQHGSNYDSRVRCTFDASKWKRTSLRKKNSSLDNRMQSISRIRDKR